MKVSSARRIAAKYLNVGTSRVKINPDETSKLKDVITGEDVKGLIAEKVFTKVGQGHSRGRARILLIKKRKGRKRGEGKKKGGKKARTNPKKLWLIKVRSQRNYIKVLLEEEKINPKSYRDLYNKVKGGFFRSKAHIDIYLSKELK